MANGHGGYRPGAGGKKKDRSFIEKCIEEAKSKGDLPHMFLAKVARGEDIDGYKPSFRERMDAATAAAPYFAPKLAAIEQSVTGEVRSIISAKPLSESEWINTYAPKPPIDEESIQ